MRKDFRRSLAVVVVFSAALNAAGCGIVEPPTTFNIPRAVPVPTLAAGGKQFTAITSGFFHTCALDADGRAWCWGDNQYRQSGQAAAGSLCDQTSTCTLRPALVETSLRFAKISAGTTTTCALTSDGAAWCWGGGYSSGAGILGNGVKTQSPSPVAVSGGLLFKSISVGGNLTCGISIDGRGYCWGTAGRVGDGANVDALVPHELVGSRTYLSIAAGASHGCAVTTDHAVYCWGTNNSGQLGNPVVADPNTGGALGSRVPVKVATSLQFESVAAGGDDNCGMTTDGNTVCWGDNHVGEVGSTPGAPIITPTPVSTPSPLASVATGTVHTCGLDRSGTVLCWGGNWFGGLGDGGSTAAGTGSERGIPKPINSSLKFSEVAPGGSHTCALAVDGKVWCWGDKGRAQNGDGWVYN